MPVDKFGLPFIYPSKTGGFFYQQEDNPQNSDFADWPDEMSFPGNGIVRMDPNGPTDFGIGKNIKGFKDSIGGCDMDFKATQARGYAYKPDDARDVEFKALISFEDIDPDDGFSISFDTGHHTSDGCCQGFAYMVNLRPASNPCEFRFRKEMWHVHYISKPFFTDSRVNFKLNGHGYVGFCGIRYNKPGAIDTTVILEMWFNPDPEDHPVDGWIKLATLEDHPGAGFGDGGDQCNGDDDQVGTWSNVQNRMKTNSSSGFCNFRSISLREIDVTKSFDDTPPPDNQCPPGQVWNGTTCVPQDGGGTPPGGGGTGQPSQISPVISYIVLASKAGGYPTLKPPMTGVQAMLLALAEDVAETMTDPNSDAIDGPPGWKTASSNIGETGEIGDTPCNHDFSDAASLPLIHTFADGLMVEPYYSNKDFDCELGLSGNPGGGEPPPGSVISGTVSQIMISDVTAFMAEGGIPTQSAFTVMVIAEEVIERMTDTENDGWHIDGIPDGGQVGERCDGPGQGGNFLDDYSDGVWVEGYWSNAKQGCIIPTLMETAGQRNPGTVAGNLTYHGGRVMTNPIVNLIFWGNDWTGQSSPSMNSIYTLVRDHFLSAGSDSGSKYWGPLSQYSGCGRPTYGEHIQYTNSDPPSKLDTDADWNKYYDMLFDVIENVFTPAHGLDALENQIYITLLPHGSVVGDEDGFFDGVNWFDPLEFTANSNVATADAVAQPNSTIDSDGIAWLEATGEIIKVANSRNDEDKQDYRWSHDMELAGVGYETTWFVKVQNMTSNGHTAMKLGGPNHSGDCGGHPELKEGNECCCWYDIGIRANGDIQTQTERPHPDNQDVDCDDCTMSNIGMSMNNHWIGLKCIVYPENENGSVTNGGIRIKFYISTDAIVDGVPTNQWNLVFNTLDTGQWMDDYEWPAYQELEMRLSNIESLNDLELYKDRVFIRRWIRGGGSGTPIPPGQTGRIVWHGGRIMKTPIVNLIFWGADWDSRATDPTKANVISYTKDKLMGTDSAYFNNLNQYAGIGKPIFGQAVTNLTWPIPTTTRVSEEDARLVINDTIERALLPQGVDFNNTIYVVVLPVNLIGYHPENNIEFSSTHGSYKPTLTVTDTGGPDQPTDIIVIQGAFTLKSDINVYTTTTCSGSELPPPPPDDPPTDPPIGGTSIFYKVSSTSNQKEISNESSSDNRTQITEKINSSSNACVGKKCVQADVLLKKESGTNDVTPLIYFKIWDSGNNVIYTSPTTFTPDELTTSFVGKTFDCSTNTHVFVVGDRVGCEWTGTDPNEFIWTAYATSDSGNTGSSGSYEVYKEGSSYDNQTGRRMSMTLWE